MRPGTLAPGNKIRFDPWIKRPTKGRKTLEERGLDFIDLLPPFLQPGVLQWEDRRQDYGESRYNLLGELHGRLFHLTYTCRGDTIRIISARRANERERKRYEHYRRTLDPSRPH
jgi:uncharacterized DUF497 family protein